MKLTIKKSAPLNEDLRLETAILHWPSLGIHEDKPETHQYALRTLSNEVLASGTKAELEAHIASKGYMRVRR